MLAGCWLLVAGTKGGAPYGSGLSWPVVSLVSHFVSDLSQDAGVDMGRLGLGTVR